MVIIYSYLKQGPNIVACIPFRYNIDDTETIESREIILETDSSITYEAVKQRIIKVLDEEKVEHGRQSTSYTDDMSNVVTIE